MVQNVAGSNRGSASRPLENCLCLLPPAGNVYLFRIRVGKTVKGLSVPTIQ